MMLTALPPGSAARTRMVGSPRSSSQPDAVRKRRGPGRGMEIGSGVNDPLGGADQVVMSGDMEFRSPYQAPQ
jgi:hypothetical protein